MAAPRFNRHHLFLGALALVWAGVMLRFGWDAISATFDCFDCLF